MKTPLRFEFFVLTSKAAASVAAADRSFSRSRQKPHLASGEANF
jgi:hypothetical protein